MTKYTLSEDERHLLAVTFEEILDSPAPPGRQKEQFIQDFMEEHSHLLLTPALLGHGLHFQSVISKFSIDTQFVTDYAYLTKDSDTWRVVLVELESSEKSLFQKNRTHVRLSGELNSALEQIGDWQLFISTYGDEVLRRLAPLRVPMPKNPVEYRYVLVIGRSPGKDKDQRRSGRLHKLREQRGIQVLTYDTIIRAVQAGSTLPKTVLRVSGAGFRFAHMEYPDTSLFADLGPDTLYLDQNQIDEWKHRGYDMDAWQRGELLEVNNKHPRSAFLSVVRRAVSALKQK